MLPPASSPTGSFSRSQAAQNQSSEPSVHQLCWCGWLKVKRKPSMPGRCRQFRTISSRFGASQVEMAEDAELVGVRLDRLDRQHVDRLAERAGRMEHRRVDPGLRHLLQRIIHRIGRDLPVMRRHLGVFPDVDLRIDDQHGGCPLLVTAPGLPSARAVSR